MVRALLRFANRLDKKLEETFGRPYRAILSVGLVVSIIRQVKELAHASQAGAGTVEIAVGILFGFVLLINQMGELSNRLDQRADQRRASKRSKGLAS